MERKLVRQGPSTLMVSLPSKWVQKYGLKKGDPITLIEEADGLLVSPPSRVAKSKRQEIDISKRSILANRTLRAAYIGGADEIRVKFTTSAQLQDLQSRALPELLGYSIVEQSADWVLIRDVSIPDPTEFHATFRRTFLLLLSMQEAITESLTNKGSWDMIPAIDQNVNRNVNVCLRLISKGFGSHEFQSPLTLLELIGDQQKDNARAWRGLPRSGPNLALWQEYCRFFRKVYELWFEFDDAKALDASKEFQKLERKLNSSKGPSSAFAHQCKTVSNLTVVLIGLRLGLVTEVSSNH